MESVAWAYNGSNEVVATITGAEVGVSYTLFSWDPVSTAPTEEATSGTLVLTVSDIGGVGGGLNSWLVYVQKESTLDIVATTVLEWGGTEYSQPIGWYYDGVDTIVAEGVFPPLDSLVLEYSSAYGAWVLDPPVSATGDRQRLTIVTLSPNEISGGEAGAPFYADVRGTGDNAFGSRLFFVGEAGAGVLGNPGGTTLWAGLPFSTVVYSEGLEDDMPAAAIGVGYLYRATDTGMIFRSDGNVWAEWVQGVAPN